MRRKHSSWSRLLALVALLAHVALPHLHAWQVGQSAASTRIEHGAVAAASAWRAETNADGDHGHHDATACPVCRALAHHGIALAAPVSPGIALASGSTPAVASGAVRTPDLSGHSSRSPPVAA